MVLTDLLKDSDSAIIVKVICEQREDGGLYLHSEQLPGLHVSEPDPRTAIEYACAVVERLLELTYGIHVNVRPGFDFEDLERALESQGQESICPSGFIIKATHKDGHEAPH